MKSWIDTFKEYNSDPQALFLELRRMRTEFLRAEAPETMRVLFANGIQVATLMGQVERAATDAAHLAELSARALWSAIYPEEAAELAELEKKE